MSEKKSGAAPKAAPKKSAAASPKKTPAKPKKAATPHKEPLAAKPAAKVIKAEAAPAQDAPKQEAPKQEELIIEVTAEATSSVSAFTRQDIFRAWWKAARPPFYIATLIPLSLGYIAARNDVGSPSLLVFAGVLLVGFILHLVANLANDLFDYLLGTDTEESIGGSRGLQDGTITVRQLRLAISGCYAAAAVLTILGVWITGLWGLVIVVLFGALASYYYVAPPVMYGYRALGEVFVFLSMGLFMTGGSYYALAGELESYVLALSIPVGLMVAGILYYQSLPEIETDAAMGKKTLVGVLGPERAVFLFKIWWPIIWLLLVTLYLADLLAWPVLLGVALSIPLHRKACQRINNSRGDWLSLDQYGKYVRMMYFAGGLFMLIALAMM